MSEDTVGLSSLSQPLKVLLLLLSILALVVPCVLGFVNFDKRIDIVETSFDKHEVSDGKNFDKLSIDVEDNEDAIHALELVDKGLTIQYQEIMNTLGELRADVKNLVRAD